MYKKQIKHFLSAFFLAIIIFPYASFAQGIKCSVELCNFGITYSIPSDNLALSISEKNYLIFDDSKILRFKNEDNDDRALYVAIAGLVLSIALSGFLPFFIDARNKKKSIRDDFWIRQVIYPKYIEKILQYSFDLQDVDHKSIDIAFAEKTIDVNAKIMILLGSLKSVSGAMGLLVDTEEVADRLMSSEENLIEIAFEGYSEERYKKFLDCAESIAVEIVRSVHKVQSEAKNKAGKWCELDKRKWLHHFKGGC